MHIRKQKKALLLCFGIGICLPILLWFLIGWFAFIIIATAIFCGIICGIFYEIPGKYNAFRDHIFAPYKTCNGTHWVKLAELHREMDTKIGLADQNKIREQYRYLKSLLTDYESRVPTVLKQTLTRKRLSRPAFYNTPQNSDHMLSQKGYYFYTKKQ